MMLVMYTSLAAKTINIVSITKDFASIAKSVGGDHVKVVSLIKGSRNLHHVNPKPSMVLKLKNADLLLRLGMDQDTWIDSLITVAKNPKLFKGNLGHLDCSERIKKLEIPKGDIHKGLGDVHQHGNPHYWLNPYNGIIIANHIKDRLSEIDPEHKLLYEQNCQRFIALLTERTKQWKEKMRSLSAARFISYHKIWSYFYDAFSLTTLGELEPLPGIPPSTKHLALLKSKLNESKSPIIIITASFYPAKTGERFAKDNQATFKHLATNVGENNIGSYIALFDYLVQELNN